MHAYLRGTVYKNFIYCIPWPQLLGLVFVLCSCTLDREAQSDRLSIYLGPLPATLDWQLSRESNSGYLNLNTMQGLFTYNMSAGKPQLTKQLLESYRSNSNFDQWQFCLRNDILWGDGRKLQVNDFIQGWQRLLDPQTASPHAYRMYLIQGAKKYHEGRADFEQVGVSQASENCFEVTLEQGSSLFPHILTSPFTFPIRADLVNHTDWPFLSGASLGDYIWSRHVHDQQSVLVPHPYRKLAEKSPNQVNIYWLDNMSTATKLFKKQQIDVIKSPDLSDLDPADIEKYYFEKRGSGITFIAFNTQSILGGDLNFRHHVRSSIDTDKLAQLLGKNFRAQDSLWPDWLWRTSTRVAPEPSHNLSPVQKELVIKLGSNRSNINNRVASVIQQQIKQKTDLKVDLQLDTSTTYFDSLKSNPFTIYRYTWTPASLDPYYYLEIFLSSSEHNHTNYKNSRLDQLIEKARVASNNEQKNLLYSQIEQHILDQESLVIPLLQHKDSYLIHKDKWLFESNEVDRIPFSQFKRKH
jgi:ABC-type oligopeptide transport system substrate-binding subunit